jgi:hypothetical protein
MHGLYYTQCQFPPRSETKKARDRCIHQCLNISRNRLGPFFFFSLGRLSCSEDWLPVAVPAFAEPALLDVLVLEALLGVGAGAFVDSLRKSREDPLGGTSTRFSLFVCVCVCVSREERLERRDDETDASS